MNIELRTLLGDLVTESRAWTARCDAHRKKINHLAWLLCAASDDSEDSEDSPTAWFSVLERARRRDDLRLERLALENLARLGVEVTFRGRDEEEAG